MGRAIASHMGFKTNREIKIHTSHRLDRSSQLKSERKKEKTRKNMEAILIAHTHAPPCVCDFELDRAEGESGTEAKEEIGRRDSSLCCCWFDFSGDTVVSGSDGGWGRRWSVVVVENNNPWSDFVLKQDQGLDCLIFEQQLERLMDIWRQVESRASGLL
ncbi:hypothetical protein L2E82_49688 [Cichorium intybus]|uniref:Uncharacterized protein n=1 Tax=Cichorium intybus TaxID=13427 RepID=A0ACB8Z033_CICIN|nr:hypothetical protein L2E82_49688 [Cichorium intybus]